MNLSASVENLVSDLVARLELTRTKSQLCSMLPRTLWIAGNRAAQQFLRRASLKLQAASAALSRLPAIFPPERLPQVIRREAELFDGKPAVDWIVRGRIADVAERYESALAYQARFNTSSSLDHWRGQSSKLPSSSPLT